MAEDRLFLIDTFSFIFRAYYANPRLKNGAALTFTRMVLRLLEHNFTWPSLAEFQTAAETSPVLAHIRGIIRTSPELEGLDEADVYRRMSELIGMCISMCYSCLINNKPDTIDAMKPVLYEIIRKAL